MLNVHRQGHLHLMQAELQTQQKTTYIPILKRRVEDYQNKNVLKSIDCAKL